MQRLYLTSGRLLQCQHVQTNKSQVLMGTGVNLLLMQLLVCWSEKLCLSLHQLHSRDLWQHREFFTTSEMEVPCNAHVKLSKRNPSPAAFYVCPKTTHPFTIQKQVHSEVHWLIKNDLFISVQNLKYSAVNIVFMNAGRAKAGITCTKHRQTPGVISAGRLFFILWFHSRVT